MSPVADAWVSKCHFRAHGRNPYICEIPPTPGSSFFDLEISPLAFSRSGARRGDAFDQIELERLSSSIGKKTPSPSSSILLAGKPGLEMVLSILEREVEICRAPVI
jgi:hypothetical protein